MKKLVTLLSVFALVFASCQKDEVVEPKDYSLFTVDTNLNSKLGKVVTDPHSGAVGAQYYYSQQFLVNFEDLEGSEVNVNSQASYKNFVFPKDPNSTLTASTTAPGEWTIALTQYKTEDSYIDNTDPNNPVTAYQEYDVVGVVVNSSKGIEVANIKDANFDTVTLADAKIAAYSKDADAIGWNWKTLNFATFTYDMVADNYYLLKVSANEIYKIRFVDFYGANEETGKLEKGHIKFQFQLLQ